MFLKITMIPYHGYDYAAYNAAAAAAAAHYADPSASAAAAAAAHHGGLVGGGLPPHPQGPRIFFKIPRVVPKQRERFETEELFKRNARDQEVSWLQVHAEWDMEAPNFGWALHIARLMYYYVQSYSSGLLQCFVIFFQASCEGLPGQ